MYRGYGNMGFQKFPNRVLESGPNEFGRYGAQYDWDAGYGITLNGTTVSAWRDRIQGRTWIQTTAGQQPQYATNFINGNNAVFANTNSKFMLSDIPIPFGSNYWLAWVFQDNAGGGVIGPHNITTTQNIGNVRVLLGNSTSGGVAPFCTSRSNTTLGTSGFRYVVAGGTSNWFVVIFTRTKIFVNGVSEPIVGVSDYISIPVMDRLFRSSNLNLQVTGYLTRLIIGNQALSDASILELSDALNSKYAIY